MAGGRRTTEFAHFCTETCRPCAHYHHTGNASGQVRAPRNGKARVGVDGLTMLAMMVVGRFVGRVDVRWLLGIGFAITTISLWLSR
jgi:hypothetical protein